MRKLFALLLTGCAILMLVSAGLEQPAAAAEETGSTLTEELVAPAEKPEDTSQASEEGETAEDPAQAQESPAEEELDRCLLVDGRPVVKEAARTTIGGATYVSLGVMAKTLDPAAQIDWDAESQTVTVTTDALKLTATVGELYLIANDRYLYLQDGVQLIDGKTMVTLDAISKAFDAVNGWDAEAGVFTVTRGSGAIQSGSEFYDQESLFWLSRVIMAESGNQPLKGRVAVGNVVLNRVKGDKWPNTIHGVLAQRNQFTTYRGGALANCKPNALSVIAAKLALDGGVVREVAGAHYFDGAPNSWAARHRPLLGVIGGHRFYG